MALQDKLYLKDLINDGLDNGISYHNISTYSNDILKPIYLDYIPDLLKETVNINLTDDEFIKYKYKPRLLAQDVYGNQEFFHIILILNNMKNFAAFNKKNIKLLNPESTTLYKILEFNQSIINRYPAKNV